MSFESVILEPPIATWPISLSVVSKTALCELRQQARTRLVTSAEQFVLRLSDVARRAGLLSGDRPLLTGDPSTTPIVMTGHQPVVFHSGLTFKYQTTEAFAEKNGLIAVAIVIDTDDGDAGAFLYPTVEASRQSLAISSGDGVRRFVSKTATLAGCPGLFSGSRLKASDVLTVELFTVKNDLRACGNESAATAFQTVADQYAALAEISPAGFAAMEANLITRWNADIGGRMLELPLSAICSFPEFIRFTALILERPFEFAQCYNQTLTTFRSEHRIRNEANPFPNLTLENDWCELPFWIVDHAAGTRHVLQIRREPDGMALECNHARLLTLHKGNVAEALTSLLFSGQQLVPRGALITATLRLLFSDLFIHGTGGGQYDPCTDALIRNWWSVEPSPFAVASASRFLFADERQKLIQLQHVESQLRDLQYNPQRFLGTKVFPKALEERLTALLHEKEAAVNQMKSARQAGESAHDIGREIQQITDAIKLEVSKEFEPRLLELRSLTDQNLSAITSRTWPWFLFPDQTI
ncbi:MAG: hypothetical protein WKF77_23365 [Planctomycetaceae bacterium]